MKRIVYLGIILSVVILFACGKSSVEDVAKDYVKKNYSFERLSKDIRSVYRELVSDNN